MWTMLQHLHVNLNANDDDEKINFASFTQSYNGRHRVMLPLVVYGLYCMVLYYRVNVKIVKTNEKVQK